MGMELLNGNDLGPTGKAFLEFARERVRGQDDAILGLARALDHSESGLRRNPALPLHSALLIGAPGSGKTHLAKTLAAFLFGSKDALIEVSCGHFHESQLDQAKLLMPDFSRQYRDDPKVKILADKQSELNQLKSGLEEELSRSKLEEREENLEKLEKLNGELELIDSALQPIFRQCRSIVIFDSIDRSSPELGGICASILSKGLAVWENGSISLFNRSFIFFTCSDVLSADSNKEEPKKISGFVPEGKIANGNGGAKDKQIYLKSWKEVKEYFRPELLGLINRTYILRPFSKEAFLKILEDELVLLLHQLEEREFPIRLAVDEAVKVFIVEKALVDSAKDVRVLRRRFDKYLRKPLGRLKNNNLVKAGDSLIAKLSLVKDKKIIAFYKS